MTLMTLMTLMKIHLIKAWSGDPKDETPLCGADKWAPAVWSDRTIYAHRVTCEECKAAQKERPGS